ncbi:MAG: chromo domain-containing protein, partial [Leptospiraceae bacterium]|nr:chromo domain-containing protein [Leptospiraceae bacterium]
NKRIETVERIHNEQDKQTSLQNSRTKRIERTFLKNGTIVYRKNDGMITKLEPRWLGPYKIFDHDERGNYSLIDTLGNGLSQKFALEKLRVVPEEQFLQDVEEVKSILKDRTVNNKIEYLVLWANGNKSWTKEEDFCSVDCINDYWRNKTNSNVNTNNNVERKGKRGRPRKNANIDRKRSLNQNSLFLLSIVFLLLIFPCLAFTTPPMQFCKSIRQTSVIDIHKICTRHNIQYTKWYQRRNKNLQVGNIADFNFINFDFLKLNPNRINIHHPEAILTSYDGLKEFYEIEKVEEPFGTVIVKPSEDGILRNGLQEKIEKIENVTLNFFSLIFTKIKGILVIIGAIFTMILLIVLFCWIRRCNNLRSTEQRLYNIPTLDLSRRLQSSERNFSNDNNENTIL